MTRVVDYLDDPTRRALIAIVEVRLIKQHVDALVNKGTFILLIYPTAIWIMIETYPNRFRLVDEGAKMGIVIIDVYIIRSGMAVARVSSRYRC
jgi:hypothetical protein